MKMLRIGNAFHPLPMLGIDMIVLTKVNFEWILKFRF